MREPVEVWGPDGSGDSLAAVIVRDWESDILAKLRQVSQALGVSVQAVRADRVLSWQHLLVARWHQERVMDADKARFVDPGVAFVCFLAGHKQIGNAMREMGVPLDRPGTVPLVLVALGGVENEAFLRALQEVGLLGEGFHAAYGPELEEQAASYWDRRFALGSQDPPARRFDRLLAAMALVSLEA
jgi:tRNA threonylcarbamoyladenosine modification (KEOPS) complex Cgi121 subunit